MDTHDVSGLPEYSHHLQQQKQILRDAQSKQGRRPTFTLSRDETIMRFIVQKMRINPPVGSYALRSAFVPNAYTPSVTRLGELNKVMIKDLTLETHHRGSYVLLRAVTNTDRMNAIMTIVEDESTDVVLLQLYNYSKEASMDSRFREGTVLIVKEPYLKVTATGGFGIRVDHVSDIMFLPDHDDFMPLSWSKRVTEIDLSANDWKVKGNEFFTQSHYHFAIECYSKALDCCSTDQEAQTIRLNRALAFLKTGQFDAALIDLDSEIQSAKLPEKLLYRKAQTLYSLQKFAECCENHTVLGTTYPLNKASREDFNRAIERLAEQKTGKYQFKQLQRKAAKDRPINLDCATYIGPVTVKPTESCGRGLFTTNEVKAGDLLICEKAFSYAFHDMDDPNQTLYLLINPQTNSMTVGAQVELLESTVQKLFKNPSMVPSFTDLHHGRYNPIGVTEVDGKAVVDTFLTERIMNLNGFGCPLSSRESHTKAMRSDTQLKDEDTQFYSCGIWLLGSYINHSCYSNARRSFIGDMMIVRATRDIPPNTEITFWYKAPLQDDSKNKQLDLSNWGFKCTCIICQEMQKTPKKALAKRKRLRMELMMAFRADNSLNTVKVEGMLAKLEATYRHPASSIPRLGLWNAYLTLGMFYAANDHHQNAIDSLFKALESLGYVIEGGRPPFPPTAPLVVKQWGLMVVELVGCWMCLAGAYRARYPWLAPQAVDFARTSYRICVGEDETFDETYSVLSKRTDGLHDTQK